MSNETPEYPKRSNTTPEYQTQVQVGTPTVTVASARGFPTVPGYEIVCELGRGGMGVVYEAKQIGLERRVALKTIIHSGAEEKVAAARFFAEAQVVASIQHVNVVKVYDFGQVANAPYMVMELLTGGSLADLLRNGAGAEATRSVSRTPNPDGNLNTTTTFASPQGSGKQLAAELSAEVLELTALGVGAAHAQGIVHRDLKPANILFAEFRQPKVADFGIAKRTTSDLTSANALIGTPSYMAPEQAAGQGKFVGPPADVWALGIILYECLAGRRPFVGHDYIALFTTIRWDDPPSIRTFVRRIPWELEVIVRKCLAKDPGDRYPTANELAEDLRRFRVGEPILARPANVVERLYKWAKRKPSKAAAYGLTLLAVFLIAITTGALKLWQDADTSRKVAELNQKDAEDARDLADKLRTQEAQARAEAERDKLAAVTARAGEEKSRKDAEAARNSAEVAQKQAERLRDREQESRQEAEAAKKRAETAQRAETTAKREVELERNQIASREYARTISTASQAYRLNDIKLANKMLGECKPEQRGWEWRYLSRIGDTSVQTLSGHKAAATSAAFSPDGMRIVTGGYDTVAHVWSVETGRIVRTLAGHKQPINCVQFSPDGGRVLTGSQDKTAVVWDTATGEVVHRFAEHRGKVLSATYSADGLRILTEDDLGEIVVWDAGAGNRILDIREKRPIFHALTLDRFAKQNVLDQLREMKPDPHYVQAPLLEEEPSPAQPTTAPTAIPVQPAAQPPTTAPPTPAPPASPAPAAGGSSSTVNVNSAPESGQPGKVVPIGGGPTLPAVRMPDAVPPLFVPAPGTWAFSPDSARFCTGRGQVSVTIRDLESGDPKATLNGHTKLIDGISLNPQGSELVTASWDGTARVWNLKTGKERLTLKGHSDLIRSATFNYKGDRIVTASNDGTAKVWDATTGEELRTLKGHTDWVLSATFSMDGTKVVTASVDRTVKVWDVRTPPDCRTIACRLPVHSARMSADGRHVAAGLEGGLEGGVTGIWNTQSLDQHAESPAIEIVKCVRYSPNGKWIATSSAFGEVRIRFANNGDLATKLASHTQSVTCVEFSPDSRYLVTGSVDRSLIVWDIGTGNVAFTLSGHLGSVQSVAISRDQQRIVSGSADGTTKIWNFKTGTLLRTVDSPILKSLPVPVAVSPNGENIAMVGGNNTAIIRSVDGKPLSALLGHSRSIRSIAYSPDGTRIVTGSDDNTAIIWDTAHATPLLTLRGHSAPLTDVSFSADGHHIITASLDGTIKMYDATGTSR